MQKRDSVGQRSDDKNNESRQGRACFSRYCFFTAHHCPGHLYIVPFPIVACTPRQNSHISPLHLSHPPRRPSRCNAGKGTGGETAGPLSCQRTITVTHMTITIRTLRVRVPATSAPHAAPLTGWYEGGGKTAAPPPYSNLLAPPRPTPLQSLGGRTGGSTVC